MSRLFPFTKLIDRLTEYLKVRGEQLKLEIMGQVARVLSYLIIFMFVTLIAIFLLFFAGVTLSIYLNSVLESDYLGYLIVCGIIISFLITALLLMRFGKIQGWLESILLRIGIDE